MLKQECGGFAMKQILSLLLAVALILSLITVPPSGAQEEAPSSPIPKQTDSTPVIHKDPPGELIIADVLIMRPVGMVACVVGLAGAIIAWPFAAMTNSCDRVCKQLINKPFNYTFARPLGQMEYDDAADPTY
jgi:hypothetical protein